MTALKGYYKKLVHLNAVFKGFLELKGYYKKLVHLNAVFFFKGSKEFLQLIVEKEKILHKCSLKGFTYATKSEF